MTDDKTNIPDVLVIGAGVVGTTLAMRLVMDGQRVALLDRDDPGAGCSMGNAGYISETGIIPPAAMAGLTKLPQMLRDPNGPLVIRPGHLPRFLPWAMAAALNTRKAEVARIIAAQAALTRRAVAEWADLLSAIGGEHLMDRKGAIIAFRTEAALEARMARVPVWTKHGMTVERITGTQVADLEPALAPGMAGGLWFPNAARSVDPLAMTQFVAEAGVRAGMALERGAARRITPDGDGWRCDLADGRSLHARRVVVSAGRWSDALLRPLGYRFLIEAERGYHLMLPTPNVQLNRPVSLGEGNFAVTPMRHGLRLAGTAEFAGRDAPMRPERSDMLFRLATPYFPGLSRQGATRWIGNRPSLPDMVPAIGRATRHDGLFYSFGHNHSGLTQAAVSARMLAEVMGGRTPSVDPVPYDLTRFRGCR